MSTLDGGDSQKLRQYLGTLIACVGGFSMGSASGWFSPATVIYANNPSIDFTSEELSWISAVMPLGVGIGMIAFASLVQKLGNRRSILYTSPFFVASWCIALSTEYWALIVARFAIGLCGAITCIAAPLFIGEIAEPSIRGRLGVVYQLCLCIGNLYAFVFGITENIYYLTISCAAIPIGCVLLLTFRESPVYFLKKGDVQKAEESLHFYRGKDYNVTGELKKLQDYIDETADGESMWELIKRKQSKKAFMICTGCHILQQLSGIKAVVFYIHSIFILVGGDVNVHVSSLTVMSTLVLATFVSVFLIENVGRKLLLIVSMFSMMLCHLGIGAFFYIKEVDEDLAQKISVIPLVLCCLYILCYSLGAGPVPWALQAEMFPARVKFIVGSVAACANWFAAFLVTKLFPTVNDAVGVYVTFWIFAGICFVGVLFTVFMVFETKGKTLEEIQVLLGAEPVTTTTTAASIINSKDQSKII